ncbi:MAG: hypothetical protein IJW32_06005 [Clostridia bacterium]|nr:hypothetical protein [Clostridia bacterium]MBQ9792362.1 hypothetical protein [Clostridia bacterium]MBQ9793268.1 hypothetical protein [Clostridia bacterium]
MKEKKGVIISAFGGTGKTTLAQKYKNVIDLESSPYKYHYENVDNADYEKLKGTKDRIRNSDYPKNYIDAINKAVKEYDIVLVRYNGDEKVDFYDLYNLDYMVCYPTKSAYKKYTKRFKDRGNSNEWIEKNQRYYEIAYERCKNFKGKKILLHDNETLEDALIKRNYTLVPKFQD